MSEISQEVDNYLRAAAALILSKRYRTRGAPVSSVINILRKSGLPLDAALKELERRLHSVGLLLKRVSILHGSKKIERFIAVIDPRIDLPEIKPYDALTLSVLALIFVRHNEKSKVSLSTLREDLVTLIEDREKADMILHKALTKLSKDNIIRIKSDEGTIELTEIGKALLPPPDLIDKVIIEALSKKVGEKNET